MNQNNKKYLVLALAALPLLNSCSDSWLDPKPLSFYTPENTYVDAAGLYSALVACERNMRHEFFTDGAPILTEMYTADIAVHGKTDESGSLVDFDNEMLPARTGVEAGRRPDLHGRRHGRIPQERQTLRLPVRGLTGRNIRPIRMCRAVPCPAHADF